MLRERVLAFSRIRVACINGIADFAEQPFAFFTGRCFAVLDLI